MSNIKKLTPRKEGIDPAKSPKPSSEGAPDAEPFFQDAEEEKIAALMASCTPYYDDKK